MRTLRDDLALSRWRQARRGWRLAVLGGVLGALVIAAAAVPASWPGIGVLLIVAWPLSVVDLRVHRLPDSIVLPALVVTVALCVATAAVTGEWVALARGVGGALALGAGLLAVQLTTARDHGLSLGDVKLGALLGLCLGWVSWPSVFLGAAAAFLTALLVTVGGAAAGRWELGAAWPFGPALLGGAGLGLLAGGPGLEWLVSVARPALIGVLLIVTVLSGLAARRARRDSLTKGGDRAARASRAAGLAARTAVFMGALVVLELVMPTVLGVAGR